MLTGLGVVLLVLTSFRAPRMKIIDALNGPGVDILYSPGLSVNYGANLLFVFEFDGLTAGTGVSYRFRADVTQKGSGTDFDNCEGSSIGSERTILGENVHSNNGYADVGYITNTCPPGKYVVTLVLRDAANVELASISADFEIRTEAGETVTPTPTPTPTSVLAGFTGWRGEYYDNVDLAGNPVLVRDDANIDFSWGSGSPATNVPSDSFSVRWQRNITFNEDRVYRFELRKNDGARVWYDGHLIMDLWEDDDDSSNHFVDLTVTTGAHLFRVEYREDEDDARVRFRWQRKGEIPTATPTPTATATIEPPLEEFKGWRGQYFNNGSTSGEPFLVRDDADVNFDWGTDSPAPGVRLDGFSVLWERVVDFEGGHYLFSIQKRGGARIWVDGQRVLSHYHNDSSTPTFSHEIFLPPGPHTVRVQYRDTGGSALVRLWWERLSPTATPTHTPTPTATPIPPLMESDSWRVEYFYNQDLAGTPDQVGTDNEINEDFSRHRPSGLPSDHFSVRWERIAALSGGLYRFTLQKDNGARVWLNGELILDHWNDCCFELIHTAEIPLIAGHHRFRVEYFEHESDAKITFSWSRIGPLPLPSATPAAPMWSATMTVGSGGGYAGYGLATGGTLSDNDFSWQSTTYTVEAILHNPFSDSVSIEFSDDFGTEGEGLSLCLGAVRLEFADARGPSARQFFWENVDPGWNDGDTVSVGLNGCGG